MLSRKFYYLFESFRTLKYSRDELEEHRSRLLQKMVGHADESSDFYGDFWDEACPENISGTGAALKELPVLEREMADQNFDDIQTGVDVRKTYATTGTSGRSRDIGFDSQAADWREAITLRSQLLNGYRPRDSVAGNWGIPDTRTGSVLRPSREIPEDESLRRQAEMIRETEPDYLLYGAHMIFRIAKEMKASGGFNGRVEAVINNGELLTSCMRNLIEEVFNAEVFSVYETAEVGQIAFECPEGGYHVNEDLVCVELLDEKGEEVEAGERGSVVVTGLVNRAMPLVRYRIGDIAVKGEGGCSCGTNFRRLERVEGREKDVVVNDSGEKVYPRQIIDALAGFHDLEKFLFVKTGSDPVVEYIPNDLFEEDTPERIREELSALGFESVKFREVEGIERKGRKAVPIRDRS